MLSRHVGSDTEMACGVSAGTDAPSGMVAVRDMMGSVMGKVQGDVGVEGAIIPLELVEVKWNFGIIDSAARHRSSSDGGSLCRGFSGRLLC